MEVKEIIFNNEQLQDKVVEFIKDIEGDKLIKEKMAGLSNLMTVVRPYDEEFSINAYNMLSNLYIKKLDYLKNAKTKADIKDILRGECISDNGYEIVEGKFYIIEEELLMWSITSLTAPLNSKGHDRYMKVFKEYFGEDLYKSVIG